MEGTTEINGWTLMFLDGQMFLREVDSELAILMRWSVVDRDRTWAARVVGTDSKVEPTADLGGGIKDLVRCRNHATDVFAFGVAAGVALRVNGSDENAQRRVIHGASCLWAARRLDVLTSAAKRATQQLSGQGP